MTHDVARFGHPLRAIGGVYAQYGHCHAATGLEQLFAIARFLTDVSELDIHVEALNLFDNARAEITLGIIVERQLGWLGCSTALAHNVGSLTASLTLNWSVVLA